jgi:hypothetical protein
MQRRVVERGENLNHCWLVFMCIRVLDSTDRDLWLVAKEHIAVEIRAPPNVRPYQYST